jgi:hypothetical protein
MKARVFFLLLSLALLSACIMETPEIRNKMGTEKPRFITDRFDFVSSDFNRAVFDSQRALWQARDYRNYEYDFTLFIGDNSEAPFDYYRCEVVVKEGKDPEMLWFEGDDPERMIPLEGALPEGIPSVYTMEGIYDYILAVIENLAVRVKEENEGFSVEIYYDLLRNTLNHVQIEHFENGVYHTFREIGIIVWHIPVVERPELSAFDRETLTFTQGEEPSLKLFMMLDTFEILPQSSQ